MGGFFGNALGFVIGGGISIYAFFDFHLSAIILLGVSYAAFIILFFADISVRRFANTNLTSYKNLFFLNPQVMEFVKEYHVFIVAPDVGRSFSAFLNLLRIFSIIFSIICFIKGYWIIGIALFVYFFIVGFLVARFDPVLYLSASMKKASGIDITELFQTIREKRENNLKDGL